MAITLQVGYNSVGDQPMLVIRNPQLRAFEAARGDAFEQLAIGHCRRNFPRSARALGDRLPDAVRDSLKRAAEHGFTGQRELCKYLNLVFTFGRDFDRSPLIHWAAPILASSLPAAAKMERLYGAGLANESDGRGYFAPFDEPR